MEESIQILELFGGIGSPRCALRNLGIKTKAIDYVEIDENAVRSYNAMFESELPYTTQSVVGWNLKPDILIHGSPCQDFSIAGHQKGAEEGSETRSSLMWETIHIIEQMGEWKPKYVIWENVKNVLSKHMRANFDRYISEMARMGYESNFEVLDAREFGLPQARERVFTISVLNGGEIRIQRSDQNTNAKHRRISDRQQRSARRLQRDAAVSSECNREKGNKTRNSDSRLCFHNNNETRQNASTSD